MRHLAHNMPRNFTSVQELVVEDDDKSEGGLSPTEASSTARPTATMLSTAEAVSIAPEENRLANEHYYYKTVNIPTGERQIICESAGKKGYYFTLMCYENTDADDLSPVFTLRYHTNGSELIISSPMFSGKDVPGYLLTEFIIVALSEMNYGPQSLSLNIQTANLTELQKGQIEKFGFTEVTSRTPKHLFSKAEEDITPKQVELNKDLQEAKRLQANYLRGEPLGVRQHAEWLRIASNLLLLSISKEAKDGIEAARDNLEVTRAYFIEALKTVPSDIWEIGMDIASQIEYAGILARLSCCVNLAPYDKDEHTSLAECSRNDTLFNESIRLYEMLNTVIGSSLSDHEKSLIASGLAEAHILRAEYLGRIPVKNGLGKIVNINEAMKRRRQRVERKQATEELEKAIKDVDTKEFKADLLAQMAEIKTDRGLPRTRSLDAGGTHKADEMLYNLAAAA
jgi:hypothetical protein